MAVVPRGDPGSGGEQAVAPIAAKANAARQWARDRCPVALSCGANTQALSQYARQKAEDPQTPFPETAECPEDIGRQLLALGGTTTRVLYMRTPDDADVEVTRESLRPIDSPQKALVAVWFDSTYRLSIPTDGGRWEGGLDAGRARAVEGGFEVLASTQRNDGGCSRRWRMRTV